MTQTGSTYILEQRRRIVAEWFAARNWPPVILHGDVHQTEAQIRTLLNGPLVNLEHLERHIAADEARPRGDFDAWSADFDRRRREDYEHAERFEADRLRRLLGR